MSKWIIAILSGALLFVGYFAYNCWQDERTAKAEVTTLKNELSTLKQKQISDNQIIAENERKKADLENESIKQKEQINELLKNNQCANEFMPDAYIERVYKRAYSLRQSADTSKSIK